MGDPAVRNQHRPMMGTSIPDNLRFKLTAFKWDVQHSPHEGPLNTRGEHYLSDSSYEQAELAYGTYTYLLGPRDRSAGAYVAIVNCRCWLVKDPTGIARIVKRTPVVVVGTKVAARVWVRREQIIQAEEGDTYPRHNQSDVSEPGAHFMRNAARRVAASRTARTRR